MQLVVYNFFRILLIYPLGQNGYIDCIGTPPLILYTLFNMNTFRTKNHNSEISGNNIAALHLHISNMKKPPLRVYSIAFLR